MEYRLYDAAIIGAGPIGIETAIALKKENIDYIHFDKGQIGETISGYPPQTQFFSSADRIAIAGVPIPMADRSKCSKEEYLAYLRAVVRQFGLRVQTYEQVFHIAREDDGTFLLQTARLDGEHRWCARNVIFAHGDMASFRELDIPGEQLPHVSHVLGDPHAYFDRRVTIVGGKNSAVEAALRCWHTGADVTICYRKNRFDDASVKYWLLPELQGRIERGEIRAVMNAVPVEITRSEVRIRHIDNDRIEELPADAVLLLTGYRLDYTLLRSLGAAFTGEEGRPVFDEETMETSVPGVYIAGTATAGEQRSYRVFIENCHIHAARIAAALAGHAPPRGDVSYGEKHQES